MFYDEEGSISERKYLTKEQLLKALEKVPTGAHLSCNIVHNLAVLSSSIPHEFIGWVDFSGEGEYVT